MSSPNVLVNYKIEHSFQMNLFGLNSKADFKDFIINSFPISAEKRYVLISKEHEPLLHTADIQPGARSFITNNKFRKSVIKSLQSSTLNDTFTIHTTNDPTVWAALSAELQGDYTLTNPNSQISTNPFNLTAVRYNNNLRKPWMESTVCDQWSFQFSISPESEIFKSSLKINSEFVKELLTNLQFLGYKKVQYRLGVSSLKNGMVVFIAGDVMFEKTVLEFIKVKMETLKSIENLQLQVFDVIIQSLVQFINDRLRRLESDSWGWTTPARLECEFLLISQMFQVLLGDNENCLHQVLSEELKILNQTRTKKHLISAYTAMSHNLTTNLLLNEKECVRTRFINLEKKYQVYKQSIQQLELTLCSLLLLNEICMFLWTVSDPGTILNDSNEQVPNVLSWMQTLVYYPIFHRFRYHGSVLLLRQCLHFIEAFIFTKYGAILIVLFSTVAAITTIVYVL
ncbi:hypothetical protein WICPIJ_004886 [Wickerhamomyces pijperi]|uniref:Uncharacterized protein n=1 Tax=Wickerhamomyces pijperi TaxID=599730 RepID=A0A9P8TMV8_WICPI|nr:hypothetical protein WICPIJ_004886 [Wickerhamomyces pijperi]